MTTEAKQLQAHRQQYKAHLAAAMRLGCRKQDVKAYVHKAICLSEEAEDGRPTWLVALEAIEAYIIMEEYSQGLLEPEKWSEQGPC